MTEDEASHAYLIWYRDLRQCGCGNPEQSWDLIREVLAACPLYEAGGTVLAEKYPFGILQFVVNVMDDAELLEHGMSWRGSWLTKKGEWLLALIDAAGGGTAVDDALEMEGFPHDGEPCPPDCEIARRWAS